MIKKILCGIALVAGFASCNGDYDNWESPQANTENEAVQRLTMSVTPVATSLIDFAELTGDNIQLFTTNLPEGLVDGYTATFSDAEGNETALTATSEGTVTVEELSGVVVTLFGSAPEVRTMTVNVSADVSIVTADGTVKAQKVGEPFTLTAKLAARYVAPAYYVIGGVLDWAASAASKEQKFSHSGANVYDDPIFTITIPAVAGGDTWFAFADDEACDAIGQGDWSKLLGNTLENGNTSLTGNLAPRTELAGIGGEGSICMPASLGADYFKITLNMRDYAYTIEPVTIASQYYVVGAIQGWSDTNKGYLFTPHSKYVLSYTTKWTGAWDLKVWSLADFGNWDMAYGTPVDGDTSAAGLLGGAGAISAPSAEYYTFTIDLSSMTYTWTKLDDQNPTEYESISLIGEFNGWGGDYDLEQVAPHNWHCVFTQESDGMLKFRANHDWGINWGFGGDGDWNVAEGIDKVGVNNGGNIYVPAGTNDVYLNDITNSMLIVAQ